LSYQLEAITTELEHDISAGRNFTSVEKVFGRKTAARLMVYNKSLDRLLPKLYNGLAYVHTRSLWTSLLYVCC